MANYYSVKIEDEKLTQEAVAEIFSYLTKHQRIRWFDFSEGGLVKYNSRGLVDIRHILEKYCIDEEAVDVEDEFESFYKSIPEEELKAMEEEWAKQKQILEEEMKNNSNNLKGFNF